MSSKLRFNSIIVAKLAKSYIVRVFLRVYLLCFLASECSLVQRAVASMKCALLCCCHWVCFYCCCCCFCLPSKWSMENVNTFWTVDSPKSGNVLCAHHRTTRMWSGKKNGVEGMSLKHTYVLPTKNPKIPNDQKTMASFARLLFVQATTRSLIYIMGEWENIYMIIIK